MASKFVPHPRYGAEPRYTGLDPDPKKEDVYLHWNTKFLSKDERRELEQTYQLIRMPTDLLSEPILGTAIRADLSRQSRATIPITHYYDLKKVCRDCGQAYIFFAEEQKYWYEELQFPADANCVRCYPCRKKIQEIQQLRERYGELCNSGPLGDGEEAEQTECRLILVAEGVFHPKQLEHVRAFLNRHPTHAKSEEFRQRLKALEVPQASSNPKK